MGACASTNVKQVQIGNENNFQYAAHQNINGARVEKINVNDDKEICCKRHGNTITHYNERTENLFCLTCFQDYKRGHTLSETRHVHEVNTFIGSIQFKQIENQTLEKLRNNLHTTEQKLLHISQIRNKLENKRNQFLDEIKLFVNTVIDLLKHLEDEICRETNRSITSVLNELKNCKAYKESDLNKLTMLKKEIERKKQTTNDVSRLQAVLNCKYFMKNNLTAKDKVYDYEAVLILNKDISLNDITGKKGDKKMVRLGNVSCEPKISSEIFDTLSDVSDAGTDDTTYTKRSSTHMTNSTSGANSSQLYNCDYEDTIVATPSQKISTALNELSAEKIDCKALNLEDRLHNNSTDKDVQVCSQVGEPNSTRSNKSLTPVPEIMDENQRRQQFLRDNALSRNISRRSSYTVTPYQKAITPRRSSQSIVSPGNIATPSFVSPRPRRHVDAMERRMATIARHIYLSKDKYLSNITDTAQLREGSIVLCDQKNERLLLLDIQFCIKDEIKLSGHPHNVTAVQEDCDKIAVTIPDENVIKLVEITGNKFDERIEVIKLQSKPKCRGIEYADGNLFYTTRNDVAVLKKDDKERIWKFKYAFREPVSLRTDKEHGVVYVSCLGAKTFGEVVKMHYKDEKIDFVISCNEINHPVCSTCDRDGYIYICDINPPSVHQVSADGKYCRRLLSSSQGKFQHVNFLEGTDMFIATENDSDTVKIYEMT